MRTSALFAGTTIGIMALALTGCASSGASGGQAAQVTSSYSCDAPDASTVKPVTIAAQSIVSNGALFAGVEQGFFARHGIELEIQQVANVAASISSVQGGTSNFGFATTVSILQAVDSGVPISMVAPFAGIAPDYYEKMHAGEAGYTTEITALVARSGIGITSPGDLSGRTVAVADAKGQAELTTRYVIDAAGGDSNTVNYTVMSFPDSLNAFKAGQIDAIFTVEPFLNQALDAGGEVISWPGVETFHDGPTSAIIASDQYIADNADTVVRMNCALRESNAFANDHQDAIRSAVATAQGVDPATLAKAIVPYFYTTVDIDGLKRFEGIMRTYQFIASDVDIEKIVIPQAVSE